MSSNVSSGGILLNSPQDVSLNTDVNLVVRLRAVPRLLQMLAEGKVVRIERCPGATFAVAVQFGHPITEVERLMGRVLLMPPTTH